MIRTNGLKTEYKLLEVISKKDNIYIIRWDYKEVKKYCEESGREIDTDIAVWAEKIFYHKPTEKEMNKIVNDYYNAIVDSKILNGFIWKDYSVWLSSENQFNYMAAYNLAVQTNGATLPVRFKFGTDDKPEYFDFVDMETFSDFYLSSVSYIQQVINEGWAAKENFSFWPYEQILNSTSL